MRQRRNTFIVVLLVLLAGLTAGSAHRHGRQEPGVFAPVAFSGPCTLSHHIAPFITQEPGPDRQKRGEKRHGKSLITEAIVAEAPFVAQPVFDYCHHNYSLFLPGGCTRQFTGNFSLRGPPHVC